jgi:hypothetical protein
VKRSPAARADHRAICALASWLLAGCHLVFPYSARDADLRRGETPLDGRRDLPLLDGRGELPDQARIDAACSSQDLSPLAPEDDGEFAVQGTNRYWDERGEPARDIYPPAIYIGYWWSGPTWGYFRFQLKAPIQAGARIAEARLKLWGKTVTTGWIPTEHALRVQGESTADAPPVAAPGDVPETSGGRVLTAQRLRWPASGGLTWKIGDYNASPDLSAIVQEVSGTQGLAAGSHLQLWLRGDFEGKVAGEVGTPEQREGPPPRLTLRHCL